MKQLFRGLMALGLGRMVPARSDFIYWTDYRSGDVMRANLDGTLSATLVNSRASAQQHVAQPSN
jgi:hypothetical protein